MKILKIKLLLLLTVLSFLVACNTNTKEESQQGPSSAKPSQISTSSIPDQTPAKQAKKLMRQYDEITNVYAINTSKKILVAIEINQMDRLKMTKLRKRTSAKLKKQFPNFKTELSTDKKLIIEIEKLENKTKHNHITNQKLKKEIKHLIELTKEKT